MTLLLPQHKTMKYIEKPNLPQGRVGSVAISCDATKAIASLKALGIGVCPVFKNSSLPLPVASHPDMQMLHIGKDEIFVSDEHLCAGELKGNFTLRKTGETLQSKYPFDVPLNACIIDRYIICNERTVSRALLNRAYEFGLNPIFVNQGYTKCSVCVIDCNSIITDDEGIFAAAGNYLIDALLISKGAIRLEGYGYGFFGGCCGKTAKDILAVNGRIESHPEHNRIIDFAQAHGVMIAELSDEPLTDIGSILPLTEQSGEALL